MLVSSRETQHIVQYLIVSHGINGLSVLMTSRQPMAPLKPHPISSSTPVQTIIHRTRSGGGPFRRGCQRGVREGTWTRAMNSMSNSRGILRTLRLMVPPSSFSGQNYISLPSSVPHALACGSACSSGSLEPSHVLRAMGMPASYLHGALCCSLGRRTTLADVERK